jgi:hypothetical protein
VSKPIKCRLLVPDGKGGYKDYTDLSDTEREEMAKKMTKRMGETLNEYYTAHVCKLGEMKKV